MNLIFFFNIGPKLAERIHSSGKDYFEYLKEPVQKSVFIKPTVEDEIIKIIAKFDQNKSPGYDGVGYFVLKKIAKEIVKPLTTICNTSISSGEVLDWLKIAKFLPIYKTKMMLKCFQIIDL